MMRKVGLSALIILTFSEFPYAREEMRSAAADVRGPSLEVIGEEI